MLTQRSERIKQARKLTRRAGRAKAGRFLAEGPQAVREALGLLDDRADRPVHVHAVFVSESAAVRHAELLEAAVAAGVQVHHAEKAALASLSETVTPQGIVAVCDTLTVPLETAIMPGAKLVAVLAEVRDPGNVGTVIRSADAAGADGVAFTTGSVDPLGGKAVRASAGSVFHLPIATDVDAADTVRHARDSGLTVLAADGSGDVDLDDAAGSGLLARPTAWVFGNEAWGMPAVTRELADAVVRVPIHGRAESLNLAGAAVVCLYASARAQRAVR
ncbi:MAG TPA: RNA methyltransferase [Jiangellaceae bacterium]